MVNWVLQVLKEEEMDRRRMIQPPLVNFCVNFSAIGMFLLLRIIS